MLAHLHIMKGRADVVLNGYAGDLILGGSYLRTAWMQEIAADELARRMFAWRNVLVPESELSSIMPCSDKLDRTQLPSARYIELMGRISGIATPDMIDRFFLENRVRRHTSMGTVLMRSVVESAACFFDYELVDLVTGIPAALRKEHKIYLGMMRETLPEAMRLPWQRTLLPPGVPSALSVVSKGVLKACRIIEKRLGYDGLASRQSPVAFGDWFRGPLASWMSDVCSGAWSVTDDVLNAAVCERVWQDHCKGHDQSLMLGTIASMRSFALALKRARDRETACLCSPVEINRNEEGARNT